jgi:methylase of polypeptide subunit release factors
VRDRFASADIQTSALDARLLAEQVFGWDGVQLLANEHSDVAPDLEDQLNDLAQRRLAGEPVARILGHKGFWWIWGLRCLRKEKICIFWIWAPGAGVLRQPSL